jgi:hypothetical protein
LFNILRFKKVVFKSKTYIASVSSVCTTQLFKRGELGLLPYKRGDPKKSPFSKGGFRGIFGLSGERIKMVSMGIVY